MFSNIDERKGYGMRCLLSAAPWKFGAFALMLLAAVASSVLMWHPRVATSAEATPPNVLIIMADDLGYSDLGCYGSEIKTPNLDSLAEQGLRFTQFYNTCRCWPTRAAMLTGYYAQQVGRDALPEVPGGAGGIHRRPAWAPLLPELLRPYGYRSYHSGKWHIDGKTREGGFDRSLSMEDHDRFFDPKRWSLDDEPQPAIALGESDYYVTSAIAEHAIECLREHVARYPHRPFFHHLTFTAPHFPLHAPTDDIARYRGQYAQGWDAIRRQRFERMKALGLVGGRLSAMEPDIGPPYHFQNAMEMLGEGEVNRELSWDELTEAQRDFQAAKMEVHAAMIDRMDREIGRVMEALHALGVAENTLVIFLSDNGASAEIMVRGDGHDGARQPGSAGTFLCLGPGWSSVANTPFRRHKTWVHEGGISTPLIVHWPAGITDRGGLRHQVGHVIDIVPTILELAGAQWPLKLGGELRPEAPGTSLVKVFKQATGGDQETATERETPRTLWWLHEGNRALRRGDMKVVAGAGEAWQLYDLSQERGEMDDLSDSQPELRDEMVAEWERLTREMTELRHRD
jgi:arylsulfatase A-like enzyme